ncbi:ifn resistance protein [Raccoonpox virus]|uniref:IFN resistance, PKR/eIF-alpha inhibitor n=1 Tax=Raccoon poxvirus TaxID=10256 RepID=A0A0G3FZX2_RACVI|nr:IFN resistance, PKR/eIF-alpha inhibitor [Raccoonpox virus]AKJ93664.1 IFN resistance, PKR/eIF-alpha inhibitor [Raccoonpox virus]AOP31295.1 ifn resistance protein [Raccoonpox virus]
MLTFCYSLPNVGDVLTGKIFERSYALYVELPEYHNSGILVESVNMNLQRYYKYRDKLLGKIVSVTVVRVDYAKGFIDVRHSR